MHTYIIYYIVFLGELKVGQESACAGDLVSYGVGLIWSAAGGAPPLQPGGHVVCKRLSRGAIGWMADGHVRAGDQYSRCT